MKKITRMLLKRLSRAARPYMKSIGLLQVSGVYNRSAMQWEPGSERVLVLAPHMDDETIGCGGSVALHRQRGAEVTVAFLTDGRHGSSELSVLQGEELQRRQRELIATRKTEARRALDALGGGTIIFLDVEDGTLQQCNWAAEKLRPVLQEIRPQLVYLPFFLEEHADHRAVSRVLLEAANGTSLEFECIGYEVWTPLFPNCLVRIDSTMSLKKEALSQYRSQLVEADYLHSCVGLNAHRSIGLLNARGGYVEAFHVSSLPEYRRLFAANSG